MYVGVNFLFRKADDESRLSEAVLPQTCILLFIVQPLVAVKFPALIVRGDVCGTITCAEAGEDLTALRDKALAAFRSNGGLKTKCKHSGILRKLKNPCFPLFVELSQAFLQ